MAKPKVPFVIVIDTREQTPFKFGDLPTIQGSLPTGDYSLMGFENEIAIERKSLSDFVGCIGNGRDRFKAELQRLKAYPCKAVIIEASLKSIMREDWKYKNPRTKIQNSHVVGAIASWRCRFGVEFIYADNHTDGAREAYRLMNAYYNLKLEEAKRFMQ